MGPKVILLSVVAIALFAFQKTFEYLEGEKSSSMPLSQLETKSILNGADPTDFLEAPAAGGVTPEKTNEMCRFGTIVGDEKASKLNEQFYVSFTKNDVTYIQVSPLIPTYLKQDQLQTVTAQAITPDDEIREQLNNLFTARNNCITADLYLQQVSRL